MKVVVAIKVHEKVIIQIQNMKIANDNHLVKLYHSSFGINMVLDGICDSFLSSEEVNSLSIGSKFEDSTNFKQILRTIAMLQNFDVKIKASEKSRVIAICAYFFGYPWRICALVYSVDHSFEVIKLDDNHCALTLIQQWTLVLMVCVGSCSKVIMAMRSTKGNEDKKIFRELKEDKKLINQ